MPETEEFDVTLGDVHELIAEAVSKYREWADRSRQVTPVGSGCRGMREAAGRLISGARRSVDVVVAAEVEQAVQVCTTLSQMLAAGRDQLTGRVLCTHATVEQDAFRRFLKEDHRLRIRVAPVPYLETVVVDGEVALVRAEGSADASVIRVPAVIEPIQALFASAWHTAAPLGGAVGPGSPLLTGSAAGILRQLHAGNTDEAAARELGVSVRTYRRYVADIMEALGTKSRFQAGVRAAESGLLPRPVPAGRRLQAA
ncbi:helix-turn-helix transcriptional regulator [Streptomyces sp. NBC_01408]|uniref:helix-turn-helix transcriptional regulator n=1 Tax=Streptomyces sp. NBC_01408 TaxID=2903855 RepID=UPI00225ADC3C|nr:helix-turn-helix transcriptional regulator [Streptomyces sp. NBC_01408]MCX4693176.1 helix-turn-helix transcriptional regulator [Streptomyces sp. NBC_01408]